MDIRSDSLRRLVLSGESGEIKAQSLDSALTRESELFIDSLMPHLSVCDSWDPVYQAWYPLLIQLVTASKRLDLAEKWSDIFAKPALNFLTADNLYSPIIREFLFLSRSGGRQFFEGIAYQDIEDFCEKCILILDHSKAINDSVLSKVTMQTDITQLLNLRTPNGLATVLFLITRKDHDFPLDPMTEQMIQQQTADWCSKYSSAFDAAQKIAEDARNRTDREIFQFYSKSNRDAILGVWYRGAKREHAVAVDSNMAYLLPSDVSEYLVSYIAGMPSELHVSRSSLDVWNILYPNIFGSRTGEFQIEDYLPLSLSKTNLKTFFYLCRDIKTLYENNTLTPHIIDYYQVGYTNGVQGCEVPVGDFIQSLRYRNFPVDKEPHNA